MPERTPRNSRPTQEARRRATTTRLVIFAAALAGVIFGLALVPYLR